MNVKDFKFLIRANKVPIVNNPIIEYVEDKRLTRLLGEIYYKKELIAKGVILNFYKEFENFYGRTKIRGFVDDFGKFRDVKTGAGERVFKLKYYTNPPLSKKERDEILKELSYVFIQFINYFVWEGNINLLTYIPSSSKIPNEIAYDIFQEMGISMKSVISKKTIGESKNLPLEEQTFDKYEIDFSEVTKSDIFVVIDDIVGTGASFCEVMYKLNRFNNKINYFLAVAKDVKR